MSSSAAVRSRTVTSAETVAASSLARLSARASGSQTIKILRQVTFRLGWPSKRTFSSPPSTV